MKQSKRLLALLLAFAMVLSLLPENFAATVKAADLSTAGELLTEEETDGDTTEEASTQEAPLLEFEAGEIEEEALSSGGAAGETQEEPLTEETEEQDPVGTLPAQEELSQGGATEEENAFLTDSYFQDQEGNKYALRYPKKAYKGETLRIELVKVSADSDAKTVVDPANYEFHAVWYAGYAATPDRTTNAGSIYSLDVKNGAYVFSYDDLAKNGVTYYSSYLKFSFSGVSDAQADYQKADGSVITSDSDIAWEGISESFVWEDPVTITAADPAEFSFTSGQTMVNAPTVTFKDGVDASNYSVSYSWYGATASSSDPAKATVKKDYSDSVSCAVQVYKRYINLYGSEATYSATNDYYSSSYKDKTAYTYVKLAATTNAAITHTYYLGYLPDIYNGDDLVIRYFDVTGEDVANVGADNISATYPASSYLTVQEKGETAVLADNLYNNSKRIVLSGESFVQKLQDADGNTKRVYPQGSKTYTLSFGEGATIGGQALTTADITLNWTLPFELDVTDGVRELVAQDGAILLKPELTPKTEGDYQTSYSWYYKSSSDQDEEWTNAPNVSSGNCYPKNNGYYRCMVEIRKSYYSASIWEASQDYHVSLVTVTPVGFLHPQTRSLYQNLDLTSGWETYPILTSVGETVTIDPDVQEADDYKITYQWYKDGKELADKKEAKLTLSGIKEEDFGIYKLVAKASLANAETASYEATYQVQVKEHPYTFDRSADTWSERNDELTLNVGVGDSIDEKIPLVLDNGYEASYQWYERKYQLAIDEIPDDYSEWDLVRQFTETVTVEGGDPVNHTVYVLANYEPISGKTAEEFKVDKLSNDDFVKVLTSGDFKYTYTLKQLQNWEYNDYPLYKCGVTIKKKDSDKELDKFAEYLNINETYNFQALYSPEQSDTNLTVAAGADLTITAPKYEIEDGYEVHYQWQKYGPIVNSDGSVYNWDYQDVADASSDKTLNTYKLSKVNEKTASYRVVITPARKGSDAALPGADTAAKTITYTVRLEDGPISGLFRTTEGSFAVKLGDSVSMGVKALLAKTEGEFALTYQWYLRGEKLPDAAKDTYKIDKVDVKQFGTYTCKVTATDSEGNAYTESIDFVVAEDKGFQVTSPVAYSNLVIGKKVGDKVALEVTAVAHETEKLTYSWYRRDNDTRSKTYGEMVKIEGADKSAYELTLKKEDFTNYVCRISDARGVYVERTFNIVYDSLTSYVEAKNGVTVIDRKVGADAELAVVPYKEDDDIKFTHQWYFVDSNGTPLKLDGEISDKLSLKSLKEEQFGTYRCYWNVVIDNIEYTTGEYVSFSLVQISDEEQNIFERVSEYGDSTNGGKNELGSKVEFGVKPASGNNNQYTYQWGFVEAGAGVTSQKLLEQTTSTLKFASITDADFGTYYLYVYDKDGNRVNTVWDEDGNTINTSFRVDKYIKTETLTVDNGEEIEIDDNGADIIVNEVIATKPKSSETLSVKAETTTQDPITYQWYRKGVAIYGATQETYELKDIKKDDFGLYRCDVRCGTLGPVSKTIYVGETANLKVTHTILPLYNGIYRYSYKRAVGDSVTFKVNAKADLTVVYQWYKGGTRIKGATSESYSIEDIKASDFGSYYCKVKAGVDSDIVYFSLERSDEFLNIVNDGVEKTLNSDSYTEVSSADAGTAVTLNVDARASQGAAISYQWYRFDQIQRRYIKLDDETAKTCKVTVTEDDLEDADIEERLKVIGKDFDTAFLTEGESSVVKRGDYKCVVSTSFRTVEYRVNFRQQEEVQLPDLAISSEGAYVSGYTYSGAYEVTLLESSLLDGESTVTYLEGYALEGAPVTLKITDRAKKTGRTYQWYERDTDGNYIKASGQTSEKYAFKAPLVKRVELGDGKIQNDIESNTYYCAAIEDDEIVDVVQYKLYSIMIPEQLSAYPKAFLYGNKTRIDNHEYTYCDVKGFRSDGAGSLLIQFAQNYEKKATLVVFDKNGNFTEYDEYHEVAGTTSTVNTDTAVFFYIWTSENSTAMKLDLSQMVASGKAHGYAVEIAKNLAVYNQEIVDAQAAAAQAAAAEQAKIAAQEAEKEALRQQVQQANAAANEAKQIAEEAKKAAGSGTATGGATGSTTSTSKNPIKTIKAKKKTVTVKAGKTVTVTFAITAKNSKAVTTDKAKTTLSGTASKGAKVTKTTISKTAIKVKVKTNKKKKGNMKLKVTIGGKSSTVTIKVK